MADAEQDDGIPKKKGSKLLLLGLLLATAGGGSGYFAVHTGLILDPPDAKGGAVTAAPDPLPDIEYVEIDPMVISLGAEARNQHLRFRAQLEVSASYASDVSTLRPRVVDVLNGYLRAVEVAELENPAALTRLRAQMLRRIQIVTGEGRVRDLLITEFVLN